MKPRGWLQPQRHLRPLHHGEGQVLVEQDVPVGIIGGVVRIRLPGQLAKRAAAVKRLPVAIVARPTVSRPDGFGG